MHQLPRRSAYSFQEMLSYCSNTAIVGLTACLGRPECSGEHAEFSADVVLPRPVDGGDFLSPVHIPIARRDTVASPRRNLIGYSDYGSCYGLVNGLEIRLQDGTLMSWNPV